MNVRVSAIIAVLALLLMWGSLLLNQDLRYVVAYGCTAIVAAVFAMLEK